MNKQEQNLKSQLNSLNQKTMVESGRRRKIELQKKLRGIQTQRSEFVSGINSSKTSFEKERQKRPNTRNNSTKKESRFMRAGKTLLGQKRKAKKQKQRQKQLVSTN